jgi:phosphoenolpyruvate carboxykinase (GTP)
MEELTGVDVPGWKAELQDIKAHYSKFGAKLPRELSDQLDALIRRLG